MPRLCKSDFRIIIIFLMKKCHEKKFTKCTLINIAAYSKNNGTIDNILCPVTKLLNKISAGFTQTVLFHTIINLTIFIMR